MFSVLQVTEFLASEVVKLERSIKDRIDGGFNESYVRADRERMTMLCEAARMLGWSCDQSRIILKKLPDLERPKVELFEITNFLANEAHKVTDVDRKFYSDAVSKLYLSSK